MDILFPILIVVIVIMIVAFVMRSILGHPNKRRSRMDRDTGWTESGSSADQYSHLGSFDTDAPSRNDFGGGADFSGAGSGGSYGEADVGGGSYDASDSGAGDSGFDGGGGDGGGGDGGGGNGGGGE